MSFSDPEDVDRSLWMLIIGATLVGVGVVLVIALPTLLETFDPSVTPSPRRT